MDLAPSCDLIIIHREVSIKYPTKVRSCYHGGDDDDVVGILEYISGQQGQWFDGMMVTDHEGLWLMKPPHSQHGNKVILLGMVNDVMCLFP